MAEKNKSKETQEQAQSWWQGFKRAVENPHVSTYDFLKKDIRHRLDLEQDEGFGDVISRAQKKAIKEALELTDPRELRNAVKMLEKNRLFFDYRSRVAIKLFRVVLDTYVVALHGENKKAPSKEEALALHAEVEHILEQELDNPDILKSVEDLAEELTHAERQEIETTVEEAKKQLKDKSSISRMADDVIRLTKTFLHPDNMANFAIHALPLITWKYRWGLAIGLGAFASRMAVYHSALGVKSLMTGDTATARHEGGKALTALKAAGGNVLAVGLSPVMGKLPKAIAGFGAFAANYIYTKTLDITKKILEMQDNEKEKGPLWKRAKNSVISFFSTNQDTLATLTASALKIKVPHKLTKTFADVTKRVKISTIRGVGRDIYSMGRAVIKNSFNNAAKATPETPLETAIILAADTEDEAQLQNQPQNQPHKPDENKTPDQTATAFNIAALDQDETNPKEPEADNGFATEQNDTEDSLEVAQAEAPRPI